jgi:hypothetical protein
MGKPYSQDLRLQVKSADHKENRRDRRLWKNQSGKRRCVVIMRERNGKTLPYVCRS